MWNICFISPKWPGLALMQHMLHILEQLFWYCVQSFYHIVCINLRQVWNVLFPWVKTYMRFDLINNSARLSKEKGLRMFCGNDSCKLFVLRPCNFTLNNIVRFFILLSNTFSHMVSIDPQLCTEQYLEVDTYIFIYEIFMKWL